MLTVFLGIVVMWASMMAVVTVLWALWEGVAWLVRALFSKRRA